MMNRLTAIRACLRVNNGVPSHVSGADCVPGQMPDRNQKDKHHG
ncbi:Uncharacterised protein [Serratia entomophila]|nr:Uncharacterised protein [Serratia entomophila]